MEKIEPDMSVLASFRAEEEKIKRQSALLEAGMKKKFDEQVKILAAARDELAKERAVLTDLIAQYTELEGQTLAEERAAVDAANTASRDLAEGRISATEAVRKHLSPEKAAAAARAQASEKLCGLTTAIRAKARTVLELEQKEATAEFEALFSSSIAPMSELEHRKQMVKSLERAVSSLMMGWPQVRHRAEQLKDRLLEATGKWLSAGRNWEGLDLAQVKALRWDLSVPESCLPALDAIVAGLASSGPDARFTVRYRRPHHPLGEGLEITAEASNVRE